MPPEKRIQLLRSYLRQPSFKGMWLSRQEIPRELLVVIFSKVITPVDAQRYMDELKLLAPSLSFRRVVFEEARARMMGDPSSPTTANRLYARAGVSRSSSCGALDS